MICHNKEKDPNLFSFSEQSIVTLLSIKTVGFFLDQFVY